ncbi:MULTISPECIES: hypothetical protein [unclassified Curtobacterium]|uniref:hypothetical protein n=1 Tax=unclassified Curtobacterium TaxID=257496 RepID=UPI00382A7D49
MLGAGIGGLLGGFLYFGSFGLGHGADLASLVFAVSAVPAAAIGGWLCALGALVAARLLGCRRRVTGAALGAGVVALVGSATFFRIYGAGSGTPKYLFSTGAVSLALVVVAAVIATVAARGAPNERRGSS